MPARRSDLKIPTLPEVWMEFRSLYSRGHPDFPEAGDYRTLEDLEAGPTVLLMAYNRRIRLFHEMIHQSNANR
jgi:hypothetical protein